MKKIILLLVLVVLFVSCGKEPVETTEIPVTDLPVTADVTDESELLVEPSALEEINALPAEEDAARLTGAPVGGNPRFFIFEEKMTYYVRVYNDMANLENVSYYKCDLNLPSGFENGEIVDVCGGAGSGEVIVSVLAGKDGYAAYLEYLFYCESLTEPEFVRETDPFWDE